MFIKTIVELSLILLFFSEVYEYTIEQCSPQMTRYENFDKLHHFFQYNFCINKFVYSQSYSQSYSYSQISQKFVEYNIIVNFSDQREQEYKSFSEV